MPIFMITIQDPNYTGQHEATEQVEMTPEEIDDDLSRWEKELLKKADKVKAAAAGRTYQTVETPEEPKDERPRKRQAMCDAFHILARSLDELPSGSEGLLAYLRKLGYRNAGKDANNSALGFYLRNRVYDVPRPLPIPTVHLDRNVVYIQIDDMVMSMNLPNGVKEYQALYGSVAGL